MLRSGKLDRMPAELQVRSARPEDAAAIGEIYATYVRTSVATFEVEPLG